MVQIGIHAYVYNIHTHWLNKHKRTHTHTHTYAHTQLHGLSWICMPAKTVPHMETPVSSLIFACHTNRNTTRKNQSYITECLMNGTIYGYLIRQCLWYLPSDNSERVHMYSPSKNKERKNPWNDIKQRFCLEKQKILGIWTGQQTKIGVLSTTKYFVLGML